MQAARPDQPSIKFCKTALNVFCQAKLNGKKPLLPPPPSPLNEAKIKASSYFWEQNEWHFHQRYFIWHKFQTKNIFFPHIQPSQTEFTVMHLHLWDSFKRFYGDVWNNYLPTLGFIITSGRSTSTFGIQVKDEHAATQRRIQGFFMFVAILVGKGLL